MYYFDGIYYQMKTQCAFILIGGMLVLYWSKFWIPSKRNIKGMIVGILGIIFGLILLNDCAYALKKPHILTHEGYFLEDRYYRKKIFTNEYFFTNDGDLAPGFRLDVFSKKKVWPDKFSQNLKYKVYYEERTNIIVRIEQME